MLEKLTDKFFFSKSLASEIGLNNAVFLNDIAYWVDYNESNNTAYNEGRYWTFGTYKDICKRHPYWTPKQVQKIIKDCKDSGWLLVGNFSKNPYDRTNWYTLSDKFIEFVENIDVRKKANRHDEEGISTNAQKGDCNKNILIKKENMKNIPPNPPEGETGKSSSHVPSKEETGFSDGLQEAFEEWIQYKAELKFKYTKTSMSSLVKRLRKSAEQYGESAVISMLQDTMSSGYKGPVWDWLTKKPQRQETPQSREEYENAWKEAIKVYGIQEF